MLRILISAGLLLSTAQGRVVRERHPVPGTVHLDLVHRFPDLHRRDSTPSVPLTNNLSSGTYLSTVQIGTPPQQLTLVVDTGSSDVWVPWSGTSLCKQQACYFGQFDPKKSSTYKTAVQDGFEIQYGGGTGAEGDYFTDTFQMGDASVDELQMGLGTQLQTGLTFGIAGIGFPSDEALSGDAQVYPNLPQQLRDSGVIATAAYSLWLDDLNDTTGTLLFGGIDTNRFQGDTLIRINMYPSAKETEISAFNVALTTVTAISPSGSDALASSSFPMLALLDSGTTLTILPPDITYQIYAEAGVVNITTQENMLAGLIPCDATGPGYLSFGFGGTNGAVVNVTLNELILSQTETPSRWPYGDRPACLFGIRPWSSDHARIILGDTFLRSAYVVYDLENLEIGLAQTNFDASATETSVVPFSSESARVPNSQAAPSQAADQLRGVAVSSTPTSYQAQAGFTGTSSPSSGGDGGGDKKSDGDSVFSAVSWVAALMCPFMLGVVML